MISKFIVRTGWFLHARMLMTVDLQLSRMPKIAIGTHKRRGKEYNVLRLLDHSNGKAQWREFSICQHTGRLPT